METETKNTEPGITGAHKLAEKWSSKIEIDGTLEDNGQMDLTSMTAQGRLRNGTHVHGSISEAIEGQATSITLPDGRSTFAVTIQTKDLSATYNGVLLRERGGDMTIVGFFKFDAASRPKGLAPPAQDEGVWVITKP